MLVSRRSQFFGMDFGHSEAMFVPILFQQRHTIGALEPLAISAFGENGGLIQEILLQVLQPPGNNHISHLGKRKIIFKSCCKRGYVGFREVTISFQK